MNDTHPSARNVLDGIETAPLEALTHAQRAVLVRIMARLAERSYRRGFQQGVTLSAKRSSALPTDLHAWRYGTSTDASPAADSQRAEASIDRLHLENEGLSRLGLPASAKVGLPVDEASSASRLVTLATEYQRAVDGSMQQSVAAQAVIAFGIELQSIDGGKAMADVYDCATETYGYTSVRGVTSLWTGVGGWSA